MEFADVGRHCEMPLCNMQDFLPFICDSCSKSFCLEHRIYESHGCNGYARKDITSLDCPICAKSIKFNRAQNPDAVWEEHFLNGCINGGSNSTPYASNSNIGAIGGKKIQSKCGHGPCKTILGPSNRFHCPKCRVDVCLSHRVPEDHGCRAVLSAIAKTKATNKNPISSTTRSKTSSNKSSRAHENNLTNHSIVTTSSNIGEGFAREEQGPVPKNDAFLTRLEKQNQSNSIRKNSSATKSNNNSLKSSPMNSTPSRTSNGAITPGIKTSTNAEIPEHAIVSASSAEYVDVCIMNFRF